MNIRVDTLKQDTVYIQYTHSVNMHYSLLFGKQRHDIVICVHLSSVGYHVMTTQTVTCSVLTPLLSLNSQQLLLLSLFLFLKFIYFPQLSKLYIVIIERRL